MARGSRRALGVALAGWCLAGCATESRNVRFLAALERQSQTRGEQAAAAPRPAPASGEDRDGSGKNGRGKDGSAPPARAPAPVDVRIAARQMYSAVACEELARQERAGAPEQGWLMLRACVERRDFVRLESLLQEPWLPELRTRHDAAVLLARVMNNRGGELASDLALLQRAKVPLYALAEVMERPRAHRGHSIVFRARPTRIHKQGAGLTVSFAECTVDGRVLSLQDDRSAGAGGLDGNGCAETGREVVGKVPTTSSRLALEQEVVVVARFDALRTRSEDTEVAQVTVLGLLRPGGAGSL